MECLALSSFLASSFLRRRRVTSESDESLGLMSPEPDNLGQNNWEDAVGCQRDQLDDLGLIAAPPTGLWSSRDSLEFNRAGQSIFGVSADDKLDSGNCDCDDGNGPDNNGLNVCGGVRYLWRPTPLRSNVMTAFSFSYPEAAGPKGAGGIAVAGRTGSSPRFLPHSTWLADLMGCSNFNTSFPGEGLIEEGMPNRRFCKATMWRVHFVLPLWKATENIP